MSKIYKVNEKYFEKIDTPEKAYILGFFYADGYNNEERGVLEFIQRDDRIDILNQIKVALNANVDLKSYKLNTHSLILCSHKISKDLANLGAVQCKSHVTVFPSNEQVPSKLIPHFIRGYFDGDGCIWNGKRKFMKFKSRPNGRIIHNVKFNITGNIELIKGIQDYLIKTLGFNKTKLNIRHKNVPNIVTLEYSGRRNIKKFYDLIYNDAEIYCNQKKEKFKEIFCALDEKSSSEIGLIAGTPEMVISSQAEINSEGSSTIPEMEVESSDSKCPTPNE